MNGCLANLFQNGIGYVLFVVFITVCRITSSSKSSSSPLTYAPSPHTYHALRHHRYITVAKADTALSRSLSPRNSLSDDIDRDIDRDRDSTNSVKFVAIANQHNHHPNGADQLALHETFFCCMQAACYCVCFYGTEMSQLIRAHDQQKKMWERAGKL